jgi:hypothetical protein
METKLEDLKIQLDALKAKNDNIEMEKLLLKNKKVLTALCYHNKICGCWGYGSGAEPGLCYCGHWAYDHH